MTQPTSVLLPGHDVPLGRYTTVRRLLPQRPRRMVGAWCFVDQFGPDDVADRPGMQIAPHPHTGLQTVTWLVHGEILHRDSLGSLQSIRPGQLNLMTSGNGIAHSEESPPDHPPVMQGLQLWIALPEDARHGEARFEHHPTLPRAEIGGLTVTVVVGSLGGATSPARVHSPLVGAELVADDATTADIPLDESFEYAILAVDGAATVGGEELKPGGLLYLGDRHPTITVDAAGPARLFLIGGEPFADPLVMWWNFVARTDEEIRQARADWMAERRFGEVRGFAGDRLPAPELPTTRMKSRDRHGNLVQDARRRDGADRRVLARTDPARPAPAARPDARPGFVPPRLRHGHPPVAQGPAGAARREDRGADRGTLGAQSDRPHPGIPAGDRAARRRDRGGARVPLRRPAGPSRSVAGGVAG